MSTRSDNIEWPFKESPIPDLLGSKPLTNKTVLLHFMHETLAHWHMGKGTWARAHGQGHVGKGTWASAHGLRHWARALPILPPCNYIISC